MNELRRLVSIEYGKEMQIKLLDQKKEEPKEDDTNLPDEIDIPINIVDE